MNGHPAVVRYELQVNARCDYCQRKGAAMQGHLIINFPEY